MHGRNVVCLFFIQLNNLKNPLLIKIGALIKEYTTSNYHANNNYYCNSVNIYLFVVISHINCFISFLSLHTCTVHVVKFDIHRDLHSLLNFQCFGHCRLC